MKKKKLNILLSFCFCLLVTSVWGLGAAADEPEYTYQYLTFDNGWKMGESPNEMRLYLVTDQGLSGTPVDAVTDGGRYVIVDPDASGGARAIHLWSTGTVTAQCSVTLDSDGAAANDAPDLWTIHECSDNEEEGFYLISPDGYEEQYLTDQPGAISGYDFNELTVGDSDVPFQIVKAENDGAFYIRTASVEEENGSDASEGGESGSAISKMFGSDTTNIWVFTGGANVAGGFEETRGQRNFTGHFEEYIRWQAIAVNSNAQSTAGLQRYVVNTGAAGRTLAEIVANWDLAVGNYHPKAVAYLIGPEDYENAEVETFKSDLALLLRASLSLREGTGLAVIQTPVSTGEEETDAKIAAFVNAAKEVVEEYAGQPGEYSRIVFLDHFAQTAGMTGLQKDGWLTEQGHYEVGKELCEATIQSSSRYPSGDDDRDLEEYGVVPAEFWDVTPTADAGNGELKVSIGQSGSWQYELRLDGETVTGLADGDSFTISGLPTEGEYVLVVRTADGDAQLVTVKGSLVNGSQSRKNVSEDLTAPQAAIAEKFAGEDPMTWLFIGDSITHGAQHTHGYDSISQLFDKFLEAAGRGRDVVINTAVSGASAYNESGQWRGTVQNLRDRVTNFASSVPDVVTIQLGSNDSESGASFKTHMEQIIEEVRRINPEAVIVLRSPTATENPNYASKGKTYGAVLKKIADENPDYILYVDQYSEMTSAMEVYRWLGSDDKVIGDGKGALQLHPGPVGHIAMFRNFVQSMGIWTEDNPVANLYYRVLTDKAVSNQPTVTVVEDEDRRSGALSVSVEEVERAGESEMGEITLTAVNRLTGVTYSVAVDTLSANETTVRVPAGDYQVTVSGVSKSAAVRVTLNTVDVSVGEIPAEEETTEETPAGEETTEETPAEEETAEKETAEKEKQGSGVNMALVIGVVALCVVGAGAAFVVKKLKKHS